MESIFSGGYSRAVTYKDLTEMKYMEMVIKESLRFMNLVPFVVRALDEEEEIGKARTSPW